LALCKALGNPQTKFKTIHVAGTNGKGSTSHMLASILQEAGYKTGLYTSPHLTDFRERIRINGNMISEQKVIDFVAQHQELFESVKPSFFEWTVALCFQHFADEKVDIAIIETGLGGRLDSTNIIEPVLSVITNIGWDHTDLLGDTLSKIAFEKAGIIKEKTPIVIGEYQEETFPVFKEKSKLSESELILAMQKVNVLYFYSSINHAAFDVQFQFGLYWKNVYSDLTGIYQEKNIRTVLACLEPMRKVGFLINEQHLRDGLSFVKKNTGLLGRWQILNKQPLTICDTGHNINGIAYVLEQIAQQNFEHLHFVIGMVKDKDIVKILALLPVNATYYFTKANIPRALSELDLQAQASNFQLKGKTYPSVKEAIAAANNAASKNDLIFIGGSTFVVAEAI
jgi:dihydrofolate synthase/folylpolyglutamate synthase